MNEHPIQGIMDTTMQQLKEMVDVNTIVGDALTTADGATIIPISKLSFGFVSGGSDLNVKGDVATQPFAGGSGAGISITPMAFMVVKGDDIKLMQVSNTVTTVERLIDMAPQRVDKFKALFEKKGE